VRPIDAPVAAAPLPRVPGTATATATGPLPRVPVAVAAGTPTPRLVPAAHHTLLDGPWVPAGGALLLVVLVLVLVRVRRVFAR
jgi:hypothetical protein